MAKLMELSNEEYHAMEGLSASGVKLILECPKKYWWRYVMGNNMNRTPAMAQGTAFHEYILERDKFKAHHYIHNKCRRGTKEYDKLLALAGEKTLIDKDFFQELRHMKKSLLTLPTVNKMLSDGETEKAIFWEHESGILLKTKPDYTNNRVVTVFDLKTTNDASPDGFSRSLHSYGYHIQAAMAIDGLKALTGKDYSFVDVAVEKEAPYCAAAWCVDDSALEIGRAAYQRAIEILVKCKAENYWPSYSEDEVEGKRIAIKTLSVPGWVQMQYERGLML